MTATLLTAPVNYIRLAGDKSPGLADVIGASPEYEYRIHQPPAATGARIRFLRRKLCEFDVRLRFYTAAHLAEYDQWKTHLKPPDRRGNARAMDIEHPILLGIDISSAVVKRFTQLERMGEKGAWKVTIRFLENRDLPKMSMATVEGSKAQPLEPAEIEMLDNDKTIKVLVDRIAR